MAKKERILARRSSEVLEESLDIRTLIKSQLFNELSFKFLLKSYEQRYLTALSKKKRLLASSEDELVSLDDYV